MSEQERFLSRWSRLKHETKAAPPAPEPEAAPEPAPAPAEPPPELPPIDSLTRESDFSAFLKDGVPEEVRKLALRRLWALEPSGPDPLDLHNLDYTMPTLGQVVSTAFQLGKGMVDTIADRQNTCEGEQNAAPHKDQDEEKP